VILINTICLETVLSIWIFIKRGCNGWGNCEWSNCGIHWAQRGIWFSFNLFSFGFTLLFMQEKQKNKKKQKKKKGKRNICLKAFDYLQHLFSLIGECSNYEYLSVALFC
jgi:hypothetical protein